MAVELGGQHARVGHDQQVAGTDPLRHFGETQLRERTRPAFHYQQTCRVTWPHRFLGDALPGQAVVEVLQRDQLFVQRSPSSTSGASASAS